MSYLGTGSDFGNFIIDWLLRMLQQYKTPDKLELGAFQHILGDNFNILCGSF